MTSPAEWTTLGEVCAAGGSIQTGPFGSQLHASDYIAAGTPVVMPTNIGENRVEEAGIARVATEHVERLSRHKVRAGDIVYSRRGDITKRALIRGPQVGWLCGTGCLLVRPGQSADPTWLSYWLGSPLVHDWLIARAVGATMPNLNTEILSALPVLLPSLDEQRRIAGVLGSLDDLIEVNRQLMADLDELGLALFRNAWDGQTWCSVSDLGTVTMGQSPPGSTYNEEGRGLVFYQGVRDFGARYPTPRVHCTAATRKADSGDILIAVRAPIGDTNVAVEPTAIGRGLAALKATQPALALRALRATSRTWSAHEGTGTVFSSISGPDLRAAKVPAVTDAVLEAHLTTLDYAHLGLAQEVAELEATRDELLPLLMSGRVRVGDVAA